MIQFPRRPMATAILIGLLAAASAHAGPFTPGNIIVYRVGSGSGALVSTGNPVFLDEFTPAGVLVQTIALPTLASGAHRPLAASGTALTDGFLTRSADGTCLAVPGYGRDPSVTNSGNLTSASGVPRVAARVSAAGELDTTTALTDAAVGSNFRSIATADCGSFWVAGGAGGIRHAALGATTSVDLSSTTFANTRVLSIFGGQLYVSASVTALRGVASVGTGLPTAGAQTLLKLAGMTDSNSNQPYAFVMADLDPAVPGVDTMYVTDDTAGTLTKFSKVGTIWTVNGAVRTPPAPATADAYRGLTGVVSSGGGVTLYATRNGNELVSLFDASGYNGAFNGTPTSLATAPADTAFRGVALAPAITMTPSAGPHGSISPATAQAVAGGAKRTFTVTPDAGYAAVVGGTCGGTLVGTTFTTDPATANCTVAATFTQIPTFVVTPSAGPHGTITPSTPRTVLIGGAASFTIAPDPKYAFAVGGTCVGTLVGNVYTVAPVTMDCTVEATFTLVTFTVTPSAGPNGTISPDTPQVVPINDPVSFVVEPAYGYSASVNSTCGGAFSATTYTTGPITADCSVQATFTPLPRYTVAPTVTGHGTVSPPDAQTVIAGQPATFTISPEAGYSTAVRGTCIGVLSGNVFTTDPIDRDCSVAFVFARKLVLFVGNSFTFGRVDPVMSYNAAGVTDLTNDMWLANMDGSNPDEPHPWGGIPGIFKTLTDQAGLEYDVSISARNAASLRGHFLNTNPAGWDLRGNIASQKWDTVVLQDLSDEPLPAGRGANANLPYFHAYVDKIESWIHGGAAEIFTESDLFGGSTASCRAITGASAGACNSVRTIAPANINARPGVQVFLYETWARPDMIGPHGTNESGQFYTAAEGLEAMTADFHDAYFGRAAANPNITGVSAVGDAFLRAVQLGIATRDPYTPEAGKIDLWHTDYFHPSKYGSYLSALVHYATITGLDPMLLGNEQAAADLGIAPGVAAQLQLVARLTVTPDTIPPVTAATVSVAANVNGWNNGSVTVIFDAADNPGGAGLGSVTYSLGGAQAGSGSGSTGSAVTIASEGVTTISYFATDVAGNAEAPRTLVIRIDATSPTLSTPSDFAVDATGPGGASVAYAVTAADNSGLEPALTCAPASGSTLAIGTHVIACTAIDAAGNSATRSFAVSVRGAGAQIARLIAAVLALRGVNGSPVLTNVLAAILQAAINSGHSAPLCSGLTAFARQLTVGPPRGMTPAQAAEFVAAANRIKLVAGCGPR